VPPTYLQASHHGYSSAIFSLTVTTLTVYMAVFEYQNQAIFNMTVFDGEPRGHIDTCFLYPNEDVVFGILKASHFSI
jgi:hypothetical protein